MYVKKQKKSPPVSVRDKNVSRQAEIIKLLNYYRGGHVRMWNYSTPRAESAERTYLSTKSATITYISGWISLNLSLAIFTTT